MPVEAVLGTAHCQDQRLWWQGLRERGEVRTLVLGAVTTPNDENTLQLTGCNCLQHL